MRMCFLSATPSSVRAFGFIGITCLALSGCAQTGFNSPLQGAQVPQWMMTAAQHQQQQIVQDRQAIRSFNPVAKLYNDLQKTRENLLAASEQANAVWKGTNFDPDSFSARAETLNPRRALRRIWNGETLDETQAQSGLAAQQLASAAVDASPAPTVGDQMGLAMAPTPEPVKGDWIAHLSSRLTTKDGQTLYTYQGALQQSVACLKECAQRFMPYLVSDGSMPHGEFNHYLRPDGSQQWSLRGRPLYTFVGDTAPGERVADGLDRSWWSIEYPYEGGTPLLAANIPTPNYAPAPFLPPEIVIPADGSVAAPSSAIPTGASGVALPTFAPLSPVGARVSSQTLAPPPPFPSSVTDFEYAQPFIKF